VFFLFDHFYYYACVEEIHLNANLSLNSLLDSVMVFRSSSVRISVSSLKAFLLFNLRVSVYKFRMNSPHSSLPLAFSKRLLTSAGTDIVAYFVKVNTT